MEGINNVYFYGVTVKTPKGLSVIVFLHCSYEDITIEENKKKSRFTIIRARDSKPKKPEIGIIGNHYISLNKEFCIKNELTEGDLIKFGINDETKSVKMELKVNKISDPVIFGFYQRIEKPGLLVKRLRNIVGREPEMVFHEEEGWIELLPAKEIS